MQREAENRAGVGGGSSGGGGDRRMKMLQQDEQPAQLQQAPQKCPRCDSLNTKFCYYNNYSLAQPRYFCKTCRRYWTHGGTLRNVPVGGGCRKGKRAKTAISGAESSCRELPPQPPPEDSIQTPPNVASITSDSLARAKEPSQPLAPMGAYYSGVGGGYLSSLAAIQSLNPSQPFNQPMNVGGDVVGSNSNLGLLAGFNVLGSLQQQQQSLFPAEHGLIQTSLANSTAASDWPQGFISNASHRASDASLWSTISTTSISGNSQSTANGSGSSSLMPNQWPHLPGYGPPP